MFKWLFAVAPEIGSRWHVPSKNPFDIKNSVTISEVKKGFVRYRLEGTQVFLSKSIRDFRGLYREIK